MGQVLEYPEAKRRRVSRKGVPVAKGMSETGQILMFTGVRYERYSQIVETKHAPSPKKREEKAR